MQLVQLCIVLVGQSSVGGDVDDQIHLLASEDRQRDGFVRAVDRLHGILENRGADGEEHAEESDENVSRRQHPQR